MPTDYRELRRRAGRLGDLEFDLGQQPLLGVDPERDRVPASGQRDHKLGFTLATWFVIDPRTARPRPNRAESELARRLRR